MSKILVDATLSEKLPAYVNKEMLNLAKKIHYHGGENIVVSDVEHKGLVTLIEKVSKGKHPFKKENMHSSLDIGTKGDSKTWTKIFKRIGIKPGDKIYAVEDVYVNAKAIAKAAREYEIQSKVYLLDSTLRGKGKKKEGDITRIKNASEISKIADRTLSMARKRKKRKELEEEALSSIISLFIVSFSLVI